MGIGGSAVAATFLQNNAYIINSGNSSLIFGTNDVERMRITSAGSLLINRITNPFESTYKLIINNGTNLNIGFGKQEGQMSIESFNDAVNVGNPLRIYAGPLILLGGNVGIGTTSPATAGGGFTGLDIRGSSGASIVMGSTVTLMSYFYVNTSGLAIETTGTIPILFNPAGTERMRITSGGNLLIGTTSDNGSRLSVQGALNCLGASAGMFTQSRSSADFMGWYAENTTFLYFFHSTFGATGRITGSSGVYTAISDINKKKDFEECNIGLNEVLQLKPLLYRLKTDNESSPKEFGFIAQEVKDLIPQAYVESNDGNDTFIGLNQMPLIAALTKAIQQQTQIIKDLETRIVTLESK
jgi:hypothetical protein